MLTCLVLHDMLGSYRGEKTGHFTPADDIQPPQAGQVEQGQNENLRNPSREAKNQRDLLKDYFNHLGALAGQEDRT